MKKGGRKSSKTQTARPATTTLRRPKQPSAEVLARREAARKRRELKRWGRQVETFLRDLAVYFLVFSYFGHLLEAVVTELRAKVEALETLGSSEDTPPAPAS